MATIIVVEELAGPAVLGRGGHSMRVLQTLHGLERLGHRVLFLEFLTRDPGPERPAVARYFGETVARWWHPDQAALLLEASAESLYGLTAEQVGRTAAEAAAVLTLAAPYRRDPYPLIADVRPRILLEQDPAYTHLWAVGGDAAEVYGEHDLYYTVGANIGSPRCSVPALGMRWRPTWNPVVLDWWSGEWPLRRPRFTTIADWRGYGYLEFEGKVLGPKAEEFRKFVELPRRVQAPLELALNIDPDDPDVAYLRRHGWELESPAVAATPEGYRDYVAGSLGEFSCAKGGYVGTRCGWFSDRSACYLAAGRPVVAQATGFEDHLPTGKGLFAVTTVDEAVDAIRSIGQQPDVHAAAARAIAREYFDSDYILRRLLAEVGVGGSAVRGHPGTPVGSER
jgi:hypothetical protein